MLHFYKAINNRIDLLANRQKLQFIGVTAF